MTPVAVGPIVLAGRIAPLGSERHNSAIDKRPSPAPWRIGPSGLAGDEQADAVHHGGPDKALHQYPFDHYTAWIEEIGDRPVLRAPGAFGENLSTTGWTEANLCIGDVVRFGGALLQISQGRQPCWKLNRRFEQKNMALRVQSSGRTGWYYRVLEAGVARPGDFMRLVDRPHPQWSLDCVSRLLYRDTNDRERLARLAALPELAESWRKLAERRVTSGRTEDWTTRLYGGQAPQ
jgi:MOSC domain-containing protein YiiM